MGKTKIQVIDDSAPVEEEKNKQKQRKSAKLESVKAIGEDTDSQRIRSEVQNIPSESDSSGPSGALRPGKQTTKKTQKPGKAKPRSKKYQEISKDLDKSKSYALDEAVELVKKLSYSKFDGTLEAHINTIQTGLRGFVSLPFSTGKKIRILAFGKEAEASGADKVGDDSTIDEIIKGKLDFDILITTAQWMPKLAKAAKTLGPRGLMPNPKNGTITDDLKAVVESYQTGKTEYKTEAKAAVIHMTMGKLKQPNEELSSNIKTIFNNLGKSKIKKFTLSPTMGPSVKLDLASV